MADEKQSTVMKIAIIALVVLVVDVIAGFVIIKFIIPQVYKTEAPAEEKSGKGKDAQAPGIQKALAPINLNPAGSNGEILSVEIVIEGPQEVIDEATAREAQIQDALTTYLSFKTVAELNDITKREDYKKEMLDRLNSILTVGALGSVYAPSWIIQFE